MKNGLEPIVERVRRYFAENPKALGPACKEVRIPYSTAKSALEPGRNPRVDTISKLASAVPEEWRAAEGRGAA